MRTLLLLTTTLAFLLSMNCHAGSELLRLPDLPCDPTTPECFSKARTLLQSVTDPIQPLINPDQAPNDHPPSALHLRNDGHPRSMSFIPPQRAAGAVVLIHGLWRGTDTFEETAKRLARQGLAVIVVTLPGHASQWEKGNNAHAEDWIEETRRAIRLASALGDKVIVGGHSTGGMLSVLATLDKRNKVDGLALFEPAIRVQFLTSTVPCLLKQVVNKTKDIPNLIKRLTGRDPCLEPTPNYFSMGCEVSKLRDIAVQKYLTEARKDAYSGRVTNREISEELGELVRVPTFMITNPKDQVVSDPDDRKFMMGVQQTNKPFLVANVPSAEHGKTPPESVHFSDHVIETLKTIYASNEPAKAELNKNANQEKVYTEVMSSLMHHKAWVSSFDQLNKSSPNAPFNSVSSLNKFKSFLTAGEPLCKSGGSSTLLQTLESWEKAKANWCEQKRVNTQALLTQLKDKLPWLAQQFNDLNEVKPANWPNRPVSGANMTNGMRDAQAAITEFQKQMQKADSELVQVARTYDTHFRTSQRSAP